MKKYFIRVALVTFLFGVLTAKAQEAKTSNYNYYICPKNHLD